MRSKARLLSVAIHSGVLLALVASFRAPHPAEPPRRPRIEHPLAFAAGALGSGSFSGGGGAHGAAPSDSRRDMEQTPAPKRQAPLGARLLTIRFGDRLDVPDLPEDIDLLLGPDLSEVMVPDPGLLPVGAPSIEGDRSPRSSGTGSGIGGRDGAGVGPAGGNGVGDGPFDPGSLDRLPVLLFKPDDPPYPAEAKAAGARGEVILQILVREDGSTEVLSTLRSVPYCVELAWDLARRYRWKPGLKDGKPVATTGIVIVRFDLVSAGT